MLLAPPAPVHGQQGNGEQRAARPGGAVPKLLRAPVDGAGQHLGPPVVLVMMVVVLGPAALPCSGRRPRLARLLPSVLLTAHAVHLRAQRGLDHGAVVAIARALHRLPQRLAVVKAGLQHAVVVVVGVAQGLVLDEVAAEAAQQHVQPDMVGDAGDAEEGRVAEGGGVTGGVGQTNDTGALWGMVIVVGGEGDESW